jgi:starch synthase (maltosyl-transferring)
VFRVRVAPLGVVPRPAVWGHEPADAMTTTAAPRIYDLHPLLAGPIYEWREHLPRIAGMGFDWLYVNAFWTPGASGSIYAISDPYELHPLVRAESREPAAQLFGWFARPRASTGWRSW